MIRCAIEKHAVAFPSKVLASNGGAHIFNITLKEDVDNGWFVGKGAFVELDRYEEAAPTAVTGKVVDKAPNGNWYVEVATAENAFFVCTVPMIEETYAQKFMKESNFFNEKDSEARVYELKPFDVVEISAEGFEGVVAKGDPVSLKAIDGVTYAQRLGK